MGTTERNNFWADLISIRWNGIDWVEELLYASLAAMDAFYQSTVFTGISAIFCICAYACSAKV